MKRLVIVIKGDEYTFGQDQILEIVMFLADFLRNTEQHTAILHFEQKDLFPKGGYDA